MAFDLRKVPCTDIVDRAERALDARLDRDAEIRKRRSIGLRTERDTWIRIEARPIEKLDGQGWGVEAAALLRDVAMPAWHQGVSWWDSERSVVWRADETDLVTDPPVKPGGILTIDPGLADSWWTTFSSSLDALAAHTTARIAVPQERVAAGIHRVFPDVDASVDEWAAAHADLAWANLTAPQCYFLDWEDWGLAPRGYDAATLWRESLALPDLASRVQHERAADLATRSGKVAQLYACAVILHAGPDHGGPLFTPAQKAAAELAAQLRP